LGNKTTLMTIYVDAVKEYPIAAIQKSARRWGHSWSHMWTDADPQELHLMANRLGLKRSYYQEHSILKHYDVTPNKRTLALQHGAIEMTAKSAIKELLRERIKNANDNTTT